VLALPFTQTELAEMVGGSRQSVNQILKSFEGRGFLEVRGHDVVIPDLGALRRRGSR
jgi:CRP-like cAMP-binding protein